MWLFKKIIDLFETEFFFISEVINIDESAFWPKNGVGKSGIDNVLNPCISKVKKKSANLYVGRAKKTKRWRNRAKQMKHFILVFHGLT